MSNMTEQQKNVLLQAWIDNRMEKDKSLLNLSVLGVGLLATFLTRAEEWPKFLCVLCVSYFFVRTIFLILRTFDKNSDYLEGVMNGNNEDILNKKTQKLMKMSRAASNHFLCGVIFTIGSAILTSSIVHDYEWLAPSLLICFLHCFSFLTFFNK